LKLYLVQETNGNNLYYLEISHNDSPNQNLQLLTMYLFWAHQ
jgi:hypothetical protein